MKELSLISGNKSVDKIYEYKNLGVVKSYIFSFSSYVDENIKKTKKKTRRDDIHFNTNAFWRQNGTSCSRTL